ncbi:hypothetical protein [Sphingomonas sp. ID0503]|uniref:hypothetical protein n=1 Tax=Sphingomonas sp. ID0503 TaxID=3399691 RepID=UPI003AFB7539
MRNARMTVLVTDQEKSAFEAVAATQGLSAGEFMRKAAARAARSDEQEYEEALKLIVPELEAMLPKWNAQIDSMRESIAEARKSIRKAIARADAAL